MADSSVTYQLVSIVEAARILALSESTVRRLVKAGRLEAEQVQRPQGHVWLVKVPAPATDQVEQPPIQIAASGGQPPALAAWVTSVLEPLVAELSVTRQQLVVQAEQIGQLRAERDGLQASILAAQTATPLSESTGAGWRRWWPVALVLAGCLGVILLLSWTR